MNFVADENVDQPIISRLRRDGHNVNAVAEMSAGINDAAVLDLASREDVILLTGDKDFGEMIFRDRRLTNGIVLVRLAGLSSTSKAKIVASAIKEHGSELSQAFTVISANNVRIRKRLV